MNPRNDPSHARDFADAFVRTPADLDELGSLLNETLSLVGAEWAAMDSEGDRPYSGARPADLAQWLAGGVGTLWPKSSRSNPARTEQEPDWRGTLLRGFVRHSIQLRHPATAAHLHCLPLKDSIATETLIALLNQSMDSFDQSGIATLIETRMIAWLRNECFADSRGGDGVFTAGGTQSNLMGLLLARERAVERRFGISAMQRGLPPDAGRLRILCQEHAHFSATQAAGLLGLGRDAVIKIAVDARTGGVDLDAARDEYDKLGAQGLLPFCFFATAGTTDRGAFDDLEGVSAFCKERELWCHADAAYGGALLFTRHRDRLRGIESVDSLTVDFHKLFFQPIACGAFLVRDAHSFACMRQHADYLNREDDVFPNLVDRSLATTRRFDALKLLISLKGLGRADFERMIDRLLELTAFARARVAGHPDLELVVEPELTTVLFRLKAADAENSAVRDRLLATGDAVIGETRLDGRVALKLTLMNPAATEADLEDLLDRVANCEARRFESPPTSGRIDAPLNLASAQSNSSNATEKTE